jgi:Pyruvate/2-oxoacid:ferredoxin oxidoreductase gamma subunit
MVSNYLIGNKLFLKEKISIECALHQVSSNGHWRYSDVHYWLELEDYIDIVSVFNHSFVFKALDREFIYCCDVTIFLKKNCKDIVDMREDKLEEILK